MMCFKDRTFCSAKCLTECDIKLTESVVKDAEAWWKDKDAPIATSDFSNTCEDFKEKK